MNHSYIITDKQGNVIFETFSKKTAMAVNKSKFTVQTAHDYLCELNNIIKLNNIER
jgi:hypothetical protein